MDKVLFLGVLGLLAALAGAQESSDQAPAGPKYKLIGDVSQQILASAGDWGSQGTPYWIFQADLKHEFSFGQAAFVADHAVYLPLTGSQTVSSTVYEAYLRYTPAENLDLDLGKKRFNIGVGQSFTVGDTINPLTSFFDQKTGFRGLQAAWTPNQWFSLTAGLSAERNLGNDRWNPASTTSGTDAAKLAYAGQVQFLWDKLQITAALCASVDRSFNPSLGTSYDLGGLILTAEGAWEFLPQGIRPDGSKPVGQWTSPGAWTQGAPAASAGLRYTFTPVTDLDITLSAEYLYWSQGWGTDEVQAWKDAKNALTTAALTSLRSALPVKGKHNAFLKAGFSGWQKVDFNTLFVVDLQDASALGQGVLTLYPVEGLDFLFTAQEATGSADSAWGGFPASTLLSSSAAQAVWSLSFQTKYHF